MVWVMSGLTSISLPCISLMAVDMLELSHDVVMVRTLLSEKVAILNDMPSVALGGKV